MPYNSIFQLLFNFIPRHHFEKAVNFPIAAVSFRGAALCEFLQLQADSFGTPISDAE